LSHRTDEFGLDRASKWMHGREPPDRIPEERTMPKIAPCLWFDGQAEEAARFYTSVFPDSRIDKVTPAVADTPSGKKGDVLTVDFTIAGQRFIGLNGGPEFTFSEAISFEIPCQDQAEVDRYWQALVAGGGEHGPCGWLKDRFGVSWQVVPQRLYELLDSPDADAAERAMQAMLQMSKLDVAELERAYAG
jgi:predicted 3-demethylubiquinone-9 3-methyltransferase (glyoxalase superfamily)